MNELEMDQCGILSWFSELYTDTWLKKSKRKRKGTINNAIGELVHTHNVLTQ